jgi:membrane protein YqaA with SNARE-associated domain
MSHSHPLHVEAPRAPSFVVPLLAFFWGLAESTVFFIAPDFLLTRLALTDWRRALVAAVWALIGSMIGGTLLWLAASQGDVQVLLRAADWVPGISRDMIIRAAQALQTHGLGAVFTGVFTAQPYKIYALHAGAQHLALLPFLFASLVARLCGFAATTMIAWGLSHAFGEHALSATKLRLHIYAWSIFYGVYFAVIR